MQVYFDVFYNFRKTFFGRPLFCQFTVPKPQKAWASDTDVHAFRSILKNTQVELTAQKLQSLDARNAVAL